MARNKKAKFEGGGIYTEIVPADATHKICSIFPKTIHLESHVLVPGCNDKTSKANLGVVDGIRYSFVEVHPKVSKTYAGGDKWNASLDVPAYDHALDLVGWVFSDETDEPTFPASEDGNASRAEHLRGRGLFVPAGDKPTADELREAQKYQREFYVKRSQKAQSWWSQHRNMRGIDEVDVIAATALGDKYEWLSGEGHLEKKSESAVLAEAIASLIASKQQEAAPVAAATRSK